MQEESETNDEDQVDCGSPVSGTPAADLPRSDAPADAVATLEENVRQLADLVGRRLREEAQSRAAFERLHREMLGYKENFLQRAQEPLYRSLIRLIDDLDVMRESDAPGEDDLGFVRAQVLEILSRQGVEPFLCEVGAYDGMRQNAERSEGVPDPADHRRVLRSLRPGYRIDERTLRPESVVIGIYRDPPEGIA